MTRRESAAESAPFAVAAAGASRPACGCGTRRTKNPVLRRLQSNLIPCREPLALVSDKLLTRISPTRLPAENFWAICRSTLRGETPRATETARVTMRLMIDVATLLMPDRASRRPTSSLSAPNIPIG